jgi:hypothetical protein
MCSSTNLYIRQFHDDCNIFICNHMMTIALVVVVVVVVVLTRLYFFYQIEPD